MNRLPTDRSPSRPSPHAFAGAFVVAAAVLLVGGCGFAAGTDAGSGHDGGRQAGLDGGGASDGGAYDAGWAYDGGAYDGGWASDGGFYDGGWVTDGGAFDGGWTIDGGAYDGGGWTDGGLVGDGGVSGYKCGDTTCTDGEVCVVSEGGAVLPDGGGNVWYACDPYPLACQTVAACDCVGMAICHSTITDCSGPIPVVTCQYP